MNTALQTSPAPSFLSYDKTALQNLSPEELDALFDETSSIIEFENFPYLIIERNSKDKESIKNYGKLFLRYNDQKLYYGETETPEIIVAMIDQYWMCDEDKEEYLYFSDKIPVFSSLSKCEINIYRMPKKNGQGQKEIVSSVEIIKGNIPAKTKEEFGLTGKKRLHCFLSTKMKIIEDLKLEKTNCVMKDEKGDIVLDKNGNAILRIVISCGGWNYSELLPFLRKPDFQRKICLVKAFINVVPSYDDPNKKVDMPCIMYEITDRELTPQQKQACLILRQSHAMELLNRLGGDAGDVSDEEGVADEVIVPDEMDPAEVKI